MLHRLPLWMLPGCAFIGLDAHEQRLADGSDTAVDADTDSRGLPPEIGDPRFAFRFDVEGRIEGIDLVFRASDPDGDLRDGEIQLIGGDVLSMADATQREGDQWSIPLLASTDGFCNPTAQSVTFSLLDGEGIATEPQTVEVDWVAFQHGQDGEESEPAVTGITPDALPAVVCGNLVGSSTGDNNEDVNLLGAAGDRYEVRLSLAPGTGNLDLYLFDEWYDFDAPDQASENGTPGFGETLLVDVGPTNRSLWFFIAGGSVFETGDWALFLQDQLPDEVTP